MKKIILITFVFLISITTNAQIWGSKRIKGSGEVITKSRKMKSFDAIAVGGNFEVILTNDNSNTLTIKADNNIMPYIITEVEGGTLKIKFKKNVNIRTSNDIIITVPVKKIKRISLGGSGKIESKDLIKTNRLSINIGGSGTVALKVDADKISTAIGGSGTIKLSGKTHKISNSLAGSGSVKAYDLTATIAQASIAGSGDVRVTVKDEINATIVGSGNFYYKGNPKHMKIKSLGSGDVIDRN